MNAHSGMLISGVVRPGAVSSPISKIKNVAGWASLSGVNFTGLSDVNFTGLSGVNFTGLSGVNFTGKAFPSAGRAQFEF